MAYNRYRGGYGRPERVEMPPPAPRRSVSPLPPPEPAPPEPAPPRPPVRNAPPGLSFPALNRLDTEDWLVMAILYLAYRSSGDWEMLAALGAYLFM